MRVGDLVEQVINEPGFPRRIGYVVKENEKHGTVTVRFFDKIPSAAQQNSFYKQHLKLVSSSASR